MAGIGLAYPRGRVALTVRGGAHIVGMGAVSANMLFHIVLASEGFIADGTVHAFLTGVFLPVAGSVSRGRECSRAAMGYRIRTRVLVLSPCASSRPGMCL